MHIYSLSAQNAYSQFILNCSIYSTNQYNYLCSFTKKRRKDFYLLSDTKGKDVQWHRHVWGTREDSLPASKCMHAIFCSAKIRYLGQGVRSFLVGLSRELRFVLHLRCEINEKPFDFSSKESVWGETVSYAEENAGIFLRRWKKKKTGEETH